MQAVKENKVYQILEAQKDRYLNEGFDIYSDDGKLVEYSPLKTIRYSEYAALQAKYNALLAEVEASKTTAKKKGE